jgi:hypothetical protein
MTGMTAQFNRGSASRHAKKTLRKERERCEKKRKKRTTKKELL